MAHRNVLASLDFDPGYQGNKLGVAERARPEAPDQLARLVAREDPRPDRHPATLGRPACGLYYVRDTCGKAGRVSP